MNCYSDLFIPFIREFLRSLMGEMGVVSGEVGVSSDMVIGIEGMRVVVVWMKDQESK